MSDWSSSWSRYGSSPDPGLERRGQLRGGGLDGRRIDVGAIAWVAAYAAAPAPVRCPKTSRSESELPPSRFAPCIPPATSPAANRPDRVVAPVSASTRIPPMM